MADEKVGIIRALFRYVRFWNWRQARYILDAADSQFSGSPQGIAAAFDMQQDKMVNQFKQLRDAIAEVESVLEGKRQQLEQLNGEEEDLLIKRDGALAQAEAAQEAGDSEGYAQHAQAYERFDARIEEIEQTQARLNAEIEETEQTMKRYMLQLTEMQAEIQKLPQQKAEAIAEHVSATKIIELNDRLGGIQTSLDRGPIDAVVNKNKQLTAKARVTEKLAGTDVKLQDQEYARVGRTSTSKDKLAASLAARKAEREGKKAAEPAEGEQERPQI